MKPVLISKYRDTTHGIPRYASELHKNIPNAELIQYNAPPDLPSSESTTYRSLPTGPASYARGKFIRHPTKLTGVNADVFHAIDPTEVPPLWLARRRPLVTTLHDLIVYTYPETFTKEAVFLSRLYLRFIEYSDQIIAISESTKRDAVDILNLPADKIDVIYHGVDERFRQLPERKVNIDLVGPSVLMVGKPQPRKNVDGVIKAISRLHEEGIQAHLYIASATEADMAQFEFMTKDLHPYLHPLGHVSDEKLIQLYNTCDVFTMPSYYEGFGFPILEAMACGAPVVTSTVSSLPDITGEAALQVDPNDPMMIAEKIAALLTDGNLAEAFIEKGIERGKKFTWDQTVCETLEVYEKATKGEK